MLIRRTFLSYLKKPIFLRGFQVSTMPNFNNKDSSADLKREENEKKHKEINKKFQEYRQTHQFDLEKPSQAGSKFITETRKKKEVQELKALFETFQTFIQDNFNNFDEKAFITLLSKINHACMITVRSCKIRNSMSLLGKWQVQSMFSKISNILVFSFVFARFLVYMMRKFGTVLQVSS